MRLRLPPDLRARGAGPVVDDSAMLPAVRRDGREFFEKSGLGHRIGLAAVVVGLGALAFRRLLVFRTDRRLGIEIEEFFFVTADTAPGLILLLTLWLLFRRREQILALPRHSGPPVLWIPLAVAAALTLAWGNFTGANDLAAPALAFTILWVAVAIRSTAAVRVVWLPALYMLLAVPIPPPLLNEVLFHFQVGSAYLSGWLLFLLDVPAVVSGDRILTHTGRFVFIESCSGVRSVMTLSMLTIVMLDLSRRRGWHAVLVLLAAPFVAFGLNSVRATLLILNPYAAVATIHTLQGIAILLAGLALLYVFDGLLGRGTGQPSEHAGLAANESPSSVSTGSGRGLSRRWAWVGATLAVLAAISLWGPVWNAEPLPSPGLPARGRPDLAGPWSSGAERPADDWILMRGVGARRALHRRYHFHGSGGESWVDLYMAIGDHSDRMSTPFSPKTVLPGGGWAIEREDVIDLAAARPNVDVRQIRRGRHRMLVCRWYEGSGGFAAETLRSLLALDHSPFRRPEPSVVVRFATELPDTSDLERRKAEKRLRRFYHASSDLRAWATSRVRGADPTRT